MNIDDDETTIEDEKLVDDKEIQPPINSKPDSGNMNVVYPISISIKPSKN